jgi:hypothetical protein
MFIESFRVVTNSNISDCYRSVSEELYSVTGVADLEND